MTYRTMTYRYPAMMQLRSAFSLLVWGLVFAGAVSYWVAGGPKEANGRIICGVFTVFLALLIFLLLQRQVRLATVIQTNELGLATRRFGRELSSVAWLEVDEVRKVGVLGGFQVRANVAGKAIDVEHTVERAGQLRAEVRSRTGK